MARRPAGWRWTPSGDVAALGAGPCEQPRRLWAAGSAGVKSREQRAWSMERGAWGMGRGRQAWGLGLGAWSVEHGATGMELGAWSMERGAWGMGRGDRTAEDRGRKTEDRKAWGIGTARGSWKLADRSSKLGREARRLRLGVCADMFRRAAETDQPAAGASHAGSPQRGGGRSAQGKRSAALAKPCAGSHSLSPNGERVRVRGEQRGAWFRRAAETDRPGAGAPHRGPPQRGGGIPAQGKRSAALG